MKKILSSLLILTLSLSALTACGKAPVTTDEVVTEESATNDTSTTDTTNEEGKADEVTATDVSIVALKGPTAMGLTKFIDAVDQGDTFQNNFNFSIKGAIDEVTPMIIQGNVDIAAVPANLASVLYNKTEGNVQVLAINTLGVLYIVENGDTIQQVSDLAGKTIYASGKGATPEYALNYILTSNGINPETDVTIEWKSEHTECLAALSTNDNAIAMLPQPFVTTAQSKIENLRIALDLTKEWDTLQQDEETPSALLTGVIVGNTEFVKNNPEAVAEFLENYETSVKFVNENIDESSALIGNYEIVDEAIAKKALPYCNITFISGDEMKEKLSGYLTILFQQNPSSIGGSLPADEFYY